MKLTDIHTHTTFSADGKGTIEEMLTRAKELGVAYYGISEHFDYDYLVNGLSFGDSPATYIDAEAYFKTARKLQNEANFCLLIGAEFGFTPNEKVFPLYEEVVKKYQPDFIVNSIHTNEKADYYFPESYEGKSREESFLGYLALVKKSLSAPYPYDIVSHLLYPTRYAPYENKEMTLKEFGKEIDEILTEIIERDKILEVNSSAKGTKECFLPGTEVLKRYYALGGRKVSFASDAHYPSRILENRDKIVKILKEIGFTYITVPCRGEHIQVEI